MSAFHGPQPGVKNHGNKGAQHTLREQKRREADIRNRSREEKLLNASITEAEHITTDPGIVAALNKAEDEIEAKAPPKPHTRRKRTITRKKKADA